MIADKPTEDLHTTDNLPANTPAFYQTFDSSCPLMFDANSDNNLTALINPDASKRTSRYKRPDPIRMQLTERDEAIITRCWEDKLLSTSDLHTLFFGARARCVHRLRILYSN